MALPSVRANVKPWLSPTNAVRDILEYFHTLKEKIVPILRTTPPFLVLIDAIVRNGSSAAPESNNVPPPRGWRNEDLGEGRGGEEGSAGSSED